MRNLEMEALQPCVPSTARRRRSSSFTHHSHRLAIAALIIWLALLAPLVSARADVRTYRPLDTWRFMIGDPAGAENPAFDDTAWQPILAPHTYTRESEASGNRRGPAWYRTTLDYAPPIDGARAYLEFDGVALVADVWVNGRRAGRHEGGYGRFRVDVTDLVRTGVNVVAVRVDNSLNADIPPLSGFTVFGGLTRPVRLVVTSDVHIDMLDYGGPGVYVDGSHATSSRADLKVVVRVANDRDRAVLARARFDLIDAHGRKAARFERLVRLPPHATTVVEASRTISRPRLWQAMDDPHLYSLVTRLEDVQADDWDLDVVETKFGFRTVKIDPDRGLLINQKPVAVHGVNLFQSGRPLRGFAIGDKEIDEDIALVKDLGATGLRLAHSQAVQRTYDRADAEGLVVWSEVPVFGSVTDSEGFSRSAVQQAREMIRQNFNHPSVIVWGLGNEIYREDAPSNRLLAELQTVVHGEDSTRPTVYAHCCGPDDAPHSRHTDVIGYNKYFGWYADQKGDMGDWLDHVRALTPRRAISISEYGAGANLDSQEDPPRRPEPSSRWHPEQYQAQVHEDNWRRLRARPFLWGTFVWMMFDTNGNDKGLVTYDRKNKKDAYYWYQANWSKRPMLRIASARFVQRTTQTVRVKVYANVESLNLTVNGKSVGDRPVEDHIALWPEVALNAGTNRIEATARVGGEVFRHTVFWTYAPAMPGTAPQEASVRPEAGTSGSR